MSHTEENFPWTVVYQADEHLQLLRYRNLKDARLFIMSYAVDLATEEWDWKWQDAENPSKEQVNEVLDEMKAYNIFLTVYRSSMMPPSDCLRKDYRNPDHRSTRVLSAAG